MRAPMLLLLLAALGAADNSFHGRRRDELEAASLKGETNLIDHGPSAGSVKPKHFDAYNHFGHRGEQMWRKLTDQEKKRYLKKLRKYKLKERKATGIANDDVRLQHLDRDQNEDQDIAGKIKRNKQAMKKKKVMKQMERKKKYYSKWNSKKRDGMYKSKHLGKKPQTP